MAKNTQSLEDEIVQWLIDLIKNEELLKKIDGVAKVDEIVKSFENKGVIPAFGIDHIARRASARAAEIVLENLGRLEVILINKSISLTTGEVLRPDILCFNSETRTFLVFEVKRDKLTERQAVTELAGYEQELRNALPFLSDYEINFVVISTHWDPLLDHAVGNFNAWSSKYCLALKVDASARPFTLSWKNAEAWQIRGSVGLPDQALQTIDIYFENIEESSGAADDEYPRTLVTALNVVARSGDRHGSHGFGMLWRDHSNLGNGKWAWTLCGIDPIAMQDWCRRHGLPSRESKLTEYLEKQARDAPLAVPVAVYKMAKESFPILRSRYCPNFEASYSWDEKLSIIRRRSTPVHFEFWGALGDYAREFVSNPVVRERYMSFMNEMEVDWTDPPVAIPLLGSICGTNPFAEGLIRCSDAFQAGVRIGLDVALCTIAEQSQKEEEKLQPLLDWSSWEVLRVVIEMAELYRVANEVEEPPPAFSTNRDRRVASCHDLSKWVLEELIGENSPIQQACFELGFDGALYFSDWLDPVEQNAFAGTHCESLVMPWRELLYELVKGARQNGEGVAIRRLCNLLNIASSSSVQEVKSSLNSMPAMKLLEVLRHDGAETLDELVFPVLHSVSPLPPMVVDWAGLKKSIRALHESGCRHPAVIVSQNGTIGTGALEKHFTILPPLANPDTHVYFLDRKSFAAMASRMTWEELQGKFG